MIMFSKSPLQIMLLSYAHYSKFLLLHTIFHLSYDHSWKAHEALVNDVKQGHLFIALFNMRWKKWKVILRMLNSSEANVCIECCCGNFEMVIYRWTSSGCYKMGFAATLASRPSPGGSRKQAHTNKRQFLTHSQKVSRKQAHTNRHRDT